MPRSDQEPRALDAVAHIKSVLAAVLSLDPESIDEDVGLSRYGLDSVSRVEFLSSLSDRFGCDLPLSMLSAGSSIRTLAHTVDKLRRFHCADLSGPKIGSVEECMRADARLPSEMAVPHSSWDGQIRTLFLTGATGFLGVHLLAALLQSSDCEVCCLVRAGDERSGLERIFEQMRKYRLDPSKLPDRLRVFCGDLGQTKYGIADSDYQWLSDHIDVIYHCGAAVDWTASYDELRHSNVLSVRSALHLATEGRVKPLHYLSSLGVCYSTVGPETVRESDVMMSYISGVHLGYFQTKVVAESLLSEAATHGFPVTIYRPSLITGSSDTGVCNPQDLVSRMIVGCILMGAAPDLDWEFDCCPVNFVADTLTRLSFAQAPGRVYHLRHPYARQWSEVVLCMNSCGYRVRLDPYEEWMDRLGSEAQDRDHPLNPLRSFFTTRVKGADGPTLPELYERNRRSQVDSSQSDAAIAACGLVYPCLEPRLFEQYIQSFSDFGLLRGCGRSPDGSKLPQEQDSRHLESLARRTLRANGVPCSGLQVERVRSASSIISDLTSWRSGVDAGLFKCRVSTDDGVQGSIGQLDLFMKVKPRDEYALEAGESVASVCGERLYQAYRVHRNLTGLAGSHKRELWLYRQRDPRLLAHLPGVAGTIDDGDQGVWALLMEDLHGKAWMDTEVTPSLWNDRLMRTVVDGLSEIHAVWFGRVGDLMNVPDMRPIISPGVYLDAVPFWEALAEHARPFITSWIGDSVVDIQNRLITTIKSWCDELEAMPRTLIHNDCNPRNIAIRGSRDREQLCMFDWELTTVGVPQRDLAEFLCFVLNESTRTADVQVLVDRHRSQLEKASGQRIDHRMWQQGFALSLQDLMLSRIPLYLMIHRVKRQRYLPNLVRNWHRLYLQFASKAPIALSALKRGPDNALCVASNEHN